MDMEKRRLKLFLILAFGISWASALVIALTGGLMNSPEIVPGTHVTLALVLEASVYMWGPALANIITRAITKESWQNAFISPKLKSGWPYWLAGWFGPGVATILGVILFFAIFPQYYDANFTALRAQLEGRESGQRDRSYDHHHQPDSHGAVDRPGPKTAFPPLARSLVGGPICSPSFRRLWATAKRCCFHRPFGAYGTGRSSPWAIITVWTTGATPGWDCC